MDKAKLLERIAGGRTDLVFELLALPDWHEVLAGGRIRPMHWFVYYNDVTALRAVLKAGGDLASPNLNEELGHAAFFGHWKARDFPIQHGADANHAQPDTGETPRHNALAKAGRPQYRPRSVRAILRHCAVAAGSARSPPR